jgi:hypothetical protein
MNKLNKIFLSLLLFGIMLGGDKSKTGTAAGGLFLINTDARGVALAGSHNSSVNGVNSINYNVAGLSRLEGYQLSIGTVNYFAGTKTSEIVFGLKLEEAVLAFRGRVFGSGNIKETTRKNPYGTGKMFRYTSNIFSVSYAQRFTETIRFGATLNYYSESDLSSSGNAISIDMGIQYKLSENIDFAVALSNVGPDVKFSTKENRVFNNGDTPNYPGLTSFNLPVRYSISTSYKKDIDKENNVAVFANFVNNSSGENDILGGLEYNYANMLFIRAGLNVRDMQQSAFNGFALGTGFNFDLAEDTLIEFGYAFRMIREDGLDNVHIFNLMLNF